MRILSVCLFACHAPNLVQNRLISRQTFCRLCLYLYSYFLISK